MAWFSTATKHLSKTAGSKTLHPVVDLNSAERFKPFCLVKRKISFWLWKNPKIVPTLLKLNDILLKDVKAEASAKIIMENYEDKPQLKIDGDLGAKLASELSLDLSTVDSFSMVAEFGDIIKTAVNWQSIEDSLQQTKVNMNHELLQELQGKHRTSLCVVLESLACKRDCMLSASSDEKVSNSDSFNIPKSPVTINVHAKGDVETVSQHHFEIPPGTVLAYSCNVLEIGSDGLVTVHVGSDRIDSSPDAEVPTFDPSAEISELEEGISYLLKSPKLAEIASALHVILGTRCVLDLLEIVSSATESRDFSVSMKNLRQCCCDSTDICFMLQAIGFSVETISNESTLCFPSSEDKSVLESCWALLDSVADLSSTQQSHLKQFSMANRQILLEIVENGLKQEMSVPANGALRKVLQWSGAEKDLLDTLGFEIKDGNIVFHWQQGDQLKDLYVALRALADV